MRINGSWKKPDQAFFLNQPLGQDSYNMMLRRIVNKVGLDQTNMDLCNSAKVGDICILKNILKSST